MQHTIFVATIATALLSSSLSVQAQSIRPEPIALPASEFPVPSATLDALITAENFTALRAHAWTLWSGVTADSTQTFKGAVLPIWETWLSEQEVFAPPGVTLARNAAGGKGTRTAALQSAVAPFGSLLAAVKISPDSATFIQAPHETPAGSGASYSYKSDADLQRLNDNFDQKNAPVADRKIIDFPAAAIDLKVVFLPVKSSGLSAIPVWNGPQDSTLPDQPVPSTWKTCVAVDPTNMRAGKAQIDCNGATIDAEIVPLNAFYSVPLDPVEAVTVNNLAQLSGNAALVGGDYRVLVAMHITSKEIANWTWA
ncbi:MAG TPA: hypothetical protein VHR44_18075, partial [Beijerinckiaceae bacterium]|nr:hypothetical protein [Beijerinckiaceae bacterium]